MSVISMPDLGGANLWYTFDGGGALRGRKNLGQTGNDSSKIYMLSL